MSPTPTACDWWRLSQVNHIGGIKVGMSWVNYFVMFTSKHSSPLLSNVSLMYSGLAKVKISTFTLFSVRSDISYSPCVANVNLIAKLSAFLCMICFIQVTLKFTIVIKNTINW